MKVIITGTTGMIGEGVLLECLAHPAITEVLSVSRKTTGKTHPKLREYLVKDFLELKEGDENLQGYDACFFCAGVSSIGMDEATYTKITYDTTMQFAKALRPHKGMTFIYVSGGGTDSTEKGRLMWARVKGKTENDLMKLPFKQAFGYRIGFVKPTDGQQHVLKMYSYVSWLFPVIRTFFPSSYNTMNQVAASMIYLVQNGYDKAVIQVKDIHLLSKQ